MKVLLYEWEAYLQYDVEWLLKERSVAYDTFRWKFADKNEDEKFLFWMEQHVELGQYDAILSVNYWPLLSVAAQQAGVKYLAWCYDNPLNVIDIGRTLGNPVNYVFLFDRKQTEQYLAAGFSTVYYLPLGVNAARMKILQVSGSDRQKYKTDLSFVGSLYESRIREIMALMDERTRGYVDAAMDAQQNLYGCFLLDDLITKELVDQVNAGIRSGHPDTSFVLLREALTFAMSSEVTRRERLILLEMLGKRFDVRLYSFQTNQVLKSVKCYPAVDYVTELPKIFACSKINLNPSLKCIQSGIPLRAFDIMGAGGFLLSNYQTELAEYFIHEQDMVLYESVEDAIEKAAFYLKHEEIRRRIADRGKEEVLSNHTLQQRLEEIFQTAGVSL